MGQDMTEGNQCKAKDHVGDGRSKGRLSSEHEVIDSVFSEAGGPVNSRNLPVSAPALTLGLLLGTSRPAFHVNVGVLNLGFYTCRASIPTEQATSLVP